MIQTIQNTFVELAEVISKIDKASYSLPSKALNNSSIGQHLRHTLEFFECLIEGYAENLVNYERRKRNLQLETDIDFALFTLKSLHDKIDLQDKDLLLFYELNDIVIQIQTNFSRELMYCLEHCIHHQALMRVAIQELTDIALDKSFGVAPSTIKYRESVPIQ